MRFNTENEGLKHLKGKRIKDPRNYHLEKQMPNTIKGCRPYFDAWLERKKFMFAPQEMIVLMGKDHRGRTGRKKQAARNRIINVFVAWTEKKPLKEELIAAGNLL